MQTKKNGSRHALLFYRRTMGRMFSATLALGLLLVLAAWLALLEPVMILGIPSNVWLFAIGVFSLAISLFSLVARSMAYVQPCDSYLKVVTPFLRMKVSYRRILSARPSQVQQIFPPDKASWAQRSFLEPFFAKTAIVIDLKGFPNDPRLLKLFLPPQMFSPRSTGLVLLVPDWLKLNTELDSFRGSWQATQGRQVQPGRTR